MDKVVRTMMDFIASDVFGKTLDASQYSLSAEEQNRLYLLSKSHDLAGIVGDVLIKNNLAANDEIKKKFQSEIMLAVYRYENINYELDMLRKILNEAKIPFVPLKGSVIREYYPEPWMRTSCDIDILVPEDKLQEAVSKIIERLGYRYEKRGYHDISLISKAGVHLELHHSIAENRESIDKLLAECFSHTFAYDGYECRFDNEFMIFHQIAHACYHFVNGGCGVRPFADVLLLCKKLSCDRNMLDEMLAKTDIKKFFDVFIKLAEVWFENAAHDQLTLRMEKFVLSGGVYGNLQNHVAVSGQKKSGAAGHLLRRIWLPYSSLCTAYPSLKGKRILQPFYEIRRWFRMLDPAARKRAGAELSEIKNLDKEKKCEIGVMLSELGLQN